MQKKNNFIPQILLQFLFAFSFILLFILSAPDAFAATTFNSYKYNYDTFLVGEDIFTIVAYRDFEILSLKVNGEKSYLIEVGKCVKDGLDEYCYEKYDWDREFLDKFEKLSPAIYLKFSKLEPKISISRSIYPAEMKYDDEGIVTVTVKNTGTKDAINLNYREMLPENVRLVSLSDGMTYSNNYIQWSSPKIAVGKEKSFYFKVKPAKYKSGDNKAFIEFTYEGILQNATSASMFYKVKSPFKLSASLSKSTVNIAEPAEYSISFTNNEPDKNIKVYSVISLPPELNILGFSSLFSKQQENVFIYEDTLSPNEEKSFKIRLMGLYTSKYNLSTVARFHVGEKYLYDEEITPFTIATGKVNPEIYLSVSNIRSGMPFEATAVLTNKEKDKSFIGINAVFYSDLFNEIITVNSLAPGQSYIFKKKYYSMLTEDKITLPIYLNGSFKTISGEEFYFSTKKSLAVSPINKTLTIIQIPGKKVVEKGQDYTFQVEVKNQKDDALKNVYVDDFFPEELEILQGNPTILLETIPRGQKVSAYVYKIRVPYDYPDNEIKVVSTAVAIIQGEEYRVSEETKIKVINATISQGNATTGNISEEGGQESQGEEGGQENPQNGDQKKKEKDGSQEEKQGFFKDLWDGIKDIFKVIFG